MDHRQIPPSLSPLQPFVPTHWFFRTLGHTGPPRSPCAASPRLQSPPRPGHLDSCPCPSTPAVSCLHIWVSAPSLCPQLLWELSLGPSLSKALTASPEGVPLSPTSSTPPQLPLGAPFSWPCTPASVSSPHSSCCPHKITRCQDPTRSSFPHIRSKPNWLCGRQAACNIWHWVSLGSFTGPGSSKLVLARS